MKTEDILNLDCRKEENRIKLNSFLYKVKPIQRRMEKLGKGRRAEVPMEVLEEVMQGLCLRYGYRIQHIIPSFDTDRFIFYNSSITKRRDTVLWVGNAYGCTMHETIAKIIVKIYADIRKEQEKDGEEA